MDLYNRLATVYDAALDRTYREHRALAAEALDVRPGSTLLDAPCGTGASFTALLGRLGPGGVLIGADASTGMLRIARRRLQREAAANVRLIRCDLARIELSTLSAADVAITQVDRLHVFLGMSVFADPQAVFKALWQLLAPGGRCVIVDVHASRLGLLGFMVNRIADADIRRRFWEPLERVADGFTLRDLPHRREHGGQIMLASGVKPIAGVDEAHSSADARPGGRF
jgi:ubiquinone/menaquinone biosynthesis C-methylase UbiE